MQTGTFAVPCGKGRNDFSEYCKHSQVKDLQYSDILVLYSAQSSEGANWFSRGGGMGFCLKSRLPPACGHIIWLGNLFLLFPQSCVIVSNADVCRCVGMADEADSKSVVCEYVWVRVPPPARSQQHPNRFFLGENWFGCFVCLKVREDSWKDTDGEGGADIFVPAPLHLEHLRLFKNAAYIDWWFT